MSALPIQPHRFTRDEYYQMADLGFFRDQRVELIEGEIVDMSPQKDRHVAGVLLATRALQRALPDRLVRPQMPLSLGSRNEPEPDVSVVTGNIRDYVGQGHPTSALLVVEVSDTTLTFDRGRKASLYARARIADYWIINLLENRLEVHRNPVADPTAPFGWRYQSLSTFARGDTLAPLAVPSAVISVDDLLP